MPWGVEGTAEARVDWDRRVREGLSADHERGWWYMRTHDSACPPGFRTQLHEATSLSTGGGPVSCVQLSEGGFRVVYPLGLWSRSSGVVKVLCGYG